jgi:uncharacterized protein DUF4189
MKRELLSALALLMVSCAAVAQQSPTNPGGFLNTDPRSPAYNPGLSAPPRPAEEGWADRWGAFASASNGAFAGVQDEKNKRQAERTALANCRAKGGENCVVKFSYYNQCGAVASGDGGSGGGRAATEKEAVELAMKSCNEKGENCQLYFMGCSLPVRVN